MTVREAMSDIIDVHLDEHEQAPYLLLHFPIPLPERHVYCPCCLNQVGPVFRMDSSLDGETQGPPCQCPCPIYARHPLINGNFS